MFVFIIQWIIISLVFIFLLHYLYNFFVNVLTIPKVKDLVNKPIDKYNIIMKDIEINNNEYKDTMNNNVINNDKSNEIVSELKDFLSELKKEEL